MHEYKDTQRFNIVEVHVAHTLAFPRYCYYQYCVLNGITGRPGGEHILRNIDCEIQRGGVAMNEVLNAKDSID